MTSDTYRTLYYAHAARTAQPSHAHSPPARCRARNAEVHIGRVLVLLSPVKRVSRDSSLHGTAAANPPARRAVGAPPRTPNSCR